MATTTVTAPISHSGQVLSRAVTFQFALDPNVERGSSLLSAPALVASR